jgi:cytoskeletal protein RodZ
MKTVGSILREARVAKGISLGDVERDTKIRSKFLEAIERDDYSPLPSISYAKGFVKNYSEYLGLNSRTVLAFFRRQTIEAPRSSLLPKSVEPTLNRSALQLTPGRFVTIVVAVLAGLFLLYLGVQYKKFNETPALTIETPKHQDVVADKRIDVLGITDPDATITVNGVSVLVRSDGKFFDQVTLEPGVNNITIVATSRLGKTTTVVREVGLTETAF